MRLFIGILLLGLALANQEECGENAHFTECGTACPLTCDNLDNRPNVCIAMCVRGCQCNNGFVKTGTGSCVKANDCPRARIDIPTNCVDEPYKGFCRANIVMWYFNQTESNCQQFVYGGCDGNGNRFRTEAECKELCKDHFKAVDCLAPPERGVCDASMPRFYYDPAEGRCKQFMYGGCRGNTNNFNSEEECNTTCKNRLTKSRAACQEDKKIGPCKAAISRFFFNNQTKRCGRNAHFTKCGTACPLTCNNLENPPDSCGTMCVQGCQCEEGFVQSKTYGCIKPEYCPKPSSRIRRICLDKPDGGFCRERRLMWNFNQSTGTCHQFLFGGCGGNGNRYKTERECLEKCKGDICGENERYNACGTYCPLTCENYDNRLLSGKRLCPAMCKNGCECKEGFLRRFDGKCVKPEQCQNKEELPTVVIRDGEGQQVKSVAGPYDEGDFLYLICEAKGIPNATLTWWLNNLLIDDGFSETSDGIIRNDLAMTLQRSDFMRELTCQAYSKNLTQPVIASIKIDLNMKPLYVRITTPRKPVNLGEVIKLDCETSGSRPEAEIVWWLDDELIQNENRSLHSQISQSDGSEGNITYSSIYLTPGIEDSGKAVTCKAENPALPDIDMRDTWILNIRYNICGENEHYNHCGTHCPLTCENYNTTDRMCPDVCDEGCECDDGFVRRTDGRCVRPERCQNVKGEISVNCSDCPDFGYCEKSLSRFYYDSEEERCKEFIFGGCGGNANNFKSEEDCKSTCKVK